MPQMLHDTNKLVTSLISPFSSLLVGVHRQIGLIRYLVMLLYMLVMVDASTLAQDAGVQLKWQPTSRISPKSNLVKFFGWHSGGFYAFRQKQGATISQQQKIYLQHFSSEGKLLKSREISLKHKGKERQLENIISLKNKIYLLSSYHNLKDRKNYLFTQEILPRSFTLSRRLSKVGELNTSSPHDPGSFEFTFSKDSLYLLAYGQHPVKKKEQEQISLTVLDTSMSVVWEKIVSLPYPNRNFTVEECRIDPSGEVFLLGVLFFDNSTRRRQGSPNYQYRILHYSNNGEQVEEYPVELRKNFITDLTFDITRNQDRLVCAGFYSEKNSYGIKGVCYLRIDLERKEIEGVATRAFDFDFLTQYYTPRQKKKAKEAEIEGNIRNQPELYDYKLDRLILRNDGGVVLIAEQYFVQRQDFWNYWNNMRETFFYYNYNDILLANIRPNGDIQWTSRIPKQQRTMNDDGLYSSYAMAIAPDRLLFLFNDNRENFSSNNLRIPRRNQAFDSDLILAELSLEGELSTFLLENTDNNPVIPMPKVCRQIGSRKLLLYGEYGRNFRTGILSY
jgi:hypothetical protein